MRPQHHLVRRHRGRRLGRRGRRADPRGRRRGRPVAGRRSRTRRGPSTPRCARSWSSSPTPTTRSSAASSRAVHRMSAASPWPRPRARCADDRPTAAGVRTRAAYGPVRSSSSVTPADPPVDLPRGFSLLHRARSSSRSRNSWASSVAGSRLSASARSATSAGPGRRSTGCRAGPRPWRPRAGRAGTYGSVESNGARSFVRISRADFVAVARPSRSSAGGRRPGGRPHARPPQPDGVQRGHRVAGPDRAGIDRVVPESCRRWSRFS